MTHVLITVKINYRHLFNDIDGAIVIKNLLNKQASEPSDVTIADGFPLSGRQVLLQLSLDF